MDVGVVERGIVIRVDGEGRMVWQSEGLSLADQHLLLSIAVDDVKADFLHEPRKAQVDNMLLSALKGLRKET